MKKTLIALCLAVGLLGSAYFIGTAVEMNQVTAAACAGGIDCD